MNLLRYQQEEYRGRGLAKAVASKLFRENVTDFAQDGLAHADVGFENLQSQGVCKSLNGRVGWSVYCKSLPIPPWIPIVTQVQGHGLSCHSRRVS
jgi:hypothetical protein